MKLLVAALVACGASAVLAQAPSPTAASSEPAARPAFSEWLEGVRAEAIARGFRQEVVDQALANIDEPMPVVIERDRTQAETVLSIEAYLARQITARRVRTGRDMLARNKATLDKVADRYGVPVKIIGGIWGMESNFGRFSGVRPTIAALATLAWDPRRSTYFRGELFNALEILSRGDIDLPRLKGSWAGAMGQPQFMPSSYLQFAEDFDGDGRRDIWTTPEDVFASIANYLKGHGWIEGQSWGREVTVSKDAAGRIAGSVGRRTGTCHAIRDMTVRLPLEQWQALGVRALGGSALPKADMEGALVSGSTRHFLVYENYDALLQYNCAHAYALSVALLGDRLAAAPAATRPAAKARPARPAAARGARPGTRATRQR
ncbi:MAG TPA: lytic murein transglycosylase [Vicinamibacterales bacterium]|nr:lytic murein transglycosylase [Vicinamibacterales bacterium]